MTPEQQQLTALCKDMDCLGAFQGVFVHRTQTGNTYFRAVWRGAGLVCLLGFNDIVNLAKKAKKEGFKLNIVGSNIAEKSVHFEDQIFLKKTEFKLSDYSAQIELSFYTI